MKIQFKKGLYITNSRENYKLDEDTEQIEDSFCFQNAREISKEWKNPPMTTDGFKC